MCHPPETLIVLNAPDANVLQIIREKEVKTNFDLSGVRL
jgi:hypothetical protein